jgi:hypothetical protein
MFFERDGVFKSVGKGCLIIEFENEDLTTSENEIIVEELISDVKKIRGEIISQSIDVEYLLNELIGVFFFGEPCEDFNIFLTSILQKEFFTFAEKMNALNYLLTNHPERFLNIGSKKRKEIITLIREILEYRNKFAHQDITINFKEKKAYIIDKKGNNLLSQEAINEFHEKIHLLSIGLSTLMLTRMYHTAGKTFDDMKKDMDDSLND